MSNIWTIISLSVALVATSCRDGMRSSVTADGDTLQLKYAELIEIVRHKGYSEVNVYDPWHKGKMLQRYVLVAHGHRENEALPHGTVVEVPLRKVIPMSTVHAELMADLGCREAIVGIADLQYVKMPYVVEQCKAGRIADVGSSISPNVEKIIDVSPDALLVSPFENSGGYGRIEETGIPFIECADYMEATPLGRAEWMRFYGMLFGKEKTADSLFSAVDSIYHALKSVAAKAADRRSVVMDKNTGSVWYVPGGRSTIGTMLADAAADYAFADESKAGSLALPFETVLHKAGDSDVWLFRYSGSSPVTYADLLNEYRGYGELKAFRNRMCYGCNVEKTRFYEETPFRPDYLLGDFIRILHPDVSLPGDLRYFQLVYDE